MKFNTGEKVVCTKSYGDIRKGQIYSIKLIRSNSFFEDKLLFDESHDFIPSKNFISLYELRRRKILNLKNKINVKTNAN